MRMPDGRHGLLFPYLVRLVWIAWSLCLPGLLAPLTACQTEPQAPLQTLQVGRPIINGTADTTAAHMAVVALVPPENSGYVGMHCSGTLITPTVVLTAAHCLEGYSLGDFDIFFGNNVWQTGTYRAVSAQQQHPSYGGLQNPVADLALVRLASAAPSSVTPIPFLPSGIGLSQADEGGPVVFSGFGVTTPGGSTEGVKMTVTSTIGKVCLGPSGCNWNGAWVVQSAMGYSQSPGGPCSGDSGGPAFVTRSGQEYLAGVTSYRDENCTLYGVSIVPQATRARSSTSRAAPSPRSVTTHRTTIMTDSPTAPIRTARTMRPARSPTPARPRAPSPAADRCRAPP